MTKTGALTVAAQGEREIVMPRVFDEQGGRTTLTQRLEYESREARDAVLKSGMESGVAASYDRLEEYLASVV